jgi:predicted RNA methylase
VGLARLARLGQVFTPAPVADLVLALALEGAAAGARVLDPACGDGVFLARAAARGVLADGVELDPAAADAARARGHAGRVRLGDFLDEPVPARLYDAVVGNPPYVRQELLGADKARIAARVAADWGDDAAWSQRADLAAAFVARALRFVRPGGRVAFVVSAALLESSYGGALAAFLDGRAHVVAAVASPRERWFRDAAVHGVILVLQRGGPAVAARCARLRVPVAEAAARVRVLADLDAVAEVRPAAPGEPLAPLLRAPSAWLQARAAASLLPLGALAEVRRGVTTGANAFFYLSRAAASARGLEPEVLRPVLRSPRAAAAIHVQAAQLPDVAFVAAEPLPAGARAHVDGHAHLATQPTLAARPRWWELPAWPARLFLTKAYNARFVQPLSDAPVVPDQRLYAVLPRPGVELETLAAVLNGTLTALAIESLGRASMGEGALELAVSDAEKLPVLDPRRVDAARVAAAFASLARRRIGDARAEAGAPDRRALDEALAAAEPALAALVPALGPALADTVEERLARARGRLTSS